MPELTVALRAHNVAASIAPAIDSALQQQDVAYELIVLDDGSTDATDAVVRSFKDPRLTLIQTGDERGDGYCYNLALARSQAPFFATLHANCSVRPGAFRMLVDACRASPNTGMALGNYLRVDAQGQATRETFRAQRAAFQDLHALEQKYQQLLLLRGNTASHLRVYRQAALAAVGRFDEHPGVDCDFDMALRITDRFRVKILSDYLYCYRQLLRTRSWIRRKQLRDWYRRARHCRRLGKTHRVSFLDEKSTVNALLARGFYEQSGLADVIKAILGRLEGWYWRLRLPTETKLYDLLVAGFPRHSFLPSTNGSLSMRRNTCRIAYYTWHFPVLSQTFINRELAALKQSGLAVEIIADEPEAVELADDNARSVLDQAHYLEPIDPNRLRAYHRSLRRSSPLNYLKSFCFVVSRHYGSYKTIYEDIAVFSRAVYLAGIATDRNIDHLHAPWADRCAFVAMLAARLAGITYSVQARAHDIHRDNYLFALAEKFEPAQFVVTNTRYNESYMKTFLSKAYWPKLTVIHNGLDLPSFRPQTKTVSSGVIRILCVARLIEQKGLVYLLKSCAVLRVKGYSFDCEIVGGTEDIYMNYYLAVKKLHKELDLESYVRFSGSLPFKDVLEKYNQADIFVLPCVIAADGSRDITPNSLIEAMAMKLAVVSTTVTGVPEIVENGVSGLLVPPNDENALSAALANLIQDCELRKKLGENARKKVEEKFDIRKNIAAYVSLFSTGTTLQRNAEPIVDHFSQV